MILEVKQIGKFGDRDVKSEYGEYTMFPYSAKILVLTRGLNGRYKTGLEHNPDKRKELEEVLGVDLGPTSDFWKSFYVRFYMPEGSMYLDTANPKQELVSIVAQANYMLAPNRDALTEDYNYKKNTIFYIHDEKEIARRASRLQEVKDEVSSLIYNMRNNKEKMLFVCHSLGIFVTDTFSVDNLYSILAKYKDGIKSKEQFERLKDVLKTPNEELQAAFYVGQAFKHNVITFDTNINKWKFLEKHIGSVKSEIVKYFKEKKNEADLSALIMEVKDKEK